jgi:glucokinase
MTKQVLLVDVEEDRATFAVGPLGSRPARRGSVACRDQAELISAILATLTKSEAADLGAAAFAAPGPATAGSIQLTHVEMRLDQDYLQDALGVPDVRLVNDFSARAMAMPLLEDERVEQIGGRRLAGQAPAAALGPSGGLGVSILNPDGFVGWVASASEGGHASLPATRKRQSDIIEQLRRSQPHVSADRVLSNRGVQEVAVAIAELDGAAPPADTIADLILEARSGQPVAREAFLLFSEWLGAVAGDLALIAGARSGVYIFSPMVLGWADLFDRGLCRASFEAKGRMSHYVADIPLYLVTEPECGLLGLSTLFDQARF